MKRIRKAALFLAAVLLIAGTAGLLSVYALTADKNKTFVIIHCIDGETGTELCSTATVSIERGIQYPVEIENGIIREGRFFVPAGDMKTKYGVRAIESLAAADIQTGYEPTDSANMRISTGPMGNGPVFFPATDGNPPMYVVDAEDRAVNFIHLFVPYVLAHDVKIACIDGDHTELYDPLWECCYLVNDQGSFHFDVPKSFTCADGRELFIEKDAAVAFCGVKYCSGKLIESCKRAERCGLCEGSGSFRGEKCIQCGGTGYDYYSGLEYETQYESGTSEYRTWELNLGRYVNKTVEHRYLCQNCHGTGTRNNAKCVTCSGSGYRIRKETVCSYCGGDGYSVCTSCHGTGWIGSEPCTSCGGVHATYVNALGFTVTRIAAGQGKKTCPCKEYAVTIDDEGYRNIGGGWHICSTRCLECGKRYPGTANPGSAYTLQSGLCTAVYDISTTYDEVFECDGYRTKISVSPFTGEGEVEIPSNRGLGIIAFVIYSEIDPDPIAEFHPVPQMPDGYTMKAPLIFSGSPLSSAHVKADPDEDDDGDPLTVRAGAGVIGETEAAEYLIDTVITNETGFKYCMVNVSRPYTLISHDRNGTEYVAEEGTVDVTIPVRLPYSLWRIEKFEMYSLDKAVMLNINEDGDMLTDQMIVLECSDTPMADISRGEQNGETRAFLPSGLKLTLDRYVAVGRHDLIPEVPKIDLGYATGLALEFVLGATGGVSVRNDRLVIDGRTVLSDRITTGAAPEPVASELASPVVTLVSERTGVPLDAALGEYQSDPDSSFVFYRKIAGDGEDELAFPLLQNAVTVSGSVNSYLGFYELSLRGIADCPTESVTDELHRAGYIWRFLALADDPLLTEPDVKVRFEPVFYYYDAEPEDEPGRYGAEPEAESGRYGAEPEPVAVCYHDIWDGVFYPIIVAGDEIDRQLIRSDGGARYTYGGVTTGRGIVMKNTEGEDAAGFLFSYSLPALFRLCGRGDDPKRTAEELGRISDTDSIWKKGGVLRIMFRITAQKGEDVLYEAGELFALDVYTDRSRRDDVISLRTS